MVKSKNFSDVFITVIAYIIVIFMALLCLIPIINTVAVSLSGKIAATSGLVSFWPVDFTLVSYQEIMKDEQFFRSFFNSIARVLLGGVINLFMIITMAYPLSKNSKQFPQKNIFMWFIIFTMLFSGGLIPSYILVSKLNLLDTIWALVLPGAVPVFNVILLMNYFKGIPDELDEAARIDGASQFTVFLKIYLPLSVPCIATVALFTLVGHWNSFFDGIIYINSISKIPLQTYIQQLTADVREMSSMSVDEIKALSQISTKTFNAAKVFVTMIPILVVYPFLQRYFVTGLVMGSVKG